MVLAGAKKKTGQTVDFPNTILCYDETKNKAQPIVGESRLVRESRVSDRLEDVSDVTAILPTAVVEAGHVRALVGSSRSGFLESEMRVFVDTKYDCVMISY
jgi:hypothetical protein